MSRWRIRSGEERDVRRWTIFFFAEECLNVEYVPPKVNYSAPLCSKPIRYPHVNASASSKLNYSAPLCSKPIRYPHVNASASSKLNYSAPLCSKPIRYPHVNASGFIEAELQRSPLFEAHSLSSR